MNVNQGDLVELFTFFAKMKADIDQYKNDHTTLEAQDRCMAMMSRDYMVSLIPNTFCPTYPNEILLLGHLNLEGEELITAGELAAHDEFGSKLKEMMEASRTCRCRQRIPVPVLVVRNKILARSAGLSDVIETVYETRSMDALNDPVAFRKRMIHMDTMWLRTLLISDICDLMTEVKSGFLGLTLVASEKGFKEYFDEGFALSALPYPGVQYFKNFVQSSGTGHYPIPPWQKFKLEPHFGRPMRLPSPYRWQDYKKWDQLELTQNIVRYLFSLLRDPKCSGMLVHCISGWDRTPHIVSLLRILLWAEGEAHQSLNVDQMLYLAIAYDWFLFGHQLSHRLKKAHEIMFYTFDVLGHLLSPDFSLYLGEYEPPTNVRDTPQKRPQTPSKASSSSSSTVSSASSSSGAPPSNTTPTAPEAPNTTVSSANATETIIDTTQSTDTTESPANDSTEVQKVDTEIKEISVDSSDATSATPEASQQNSDTNSPTKPSPDDNNSSAGEETAPSPQIVSPEPVPATASTSNPATPRKENPTPPVSEMLNQSIVGLSLEDRIDARKHRLFELRDRFFYFYKTCVYPTYRK